MITSRKLIVCFLIVSLFLCSWPQQNSASDSKKTLLIISASWCNPCKRAENDMSNNKSLKLKLISYNIISIDFDKDVEIVKAYNVRSVPTFILTEDGKEISRKSGYTTPQSLIKFLQQ